MEKNVQKMCPEVILLHCRAVVMPDDSLLFLKTSRSPTPDQPLRLSTLVMFLILCASDARRGERKKKRFGCCLVGVEKNR